LKLIQRRIDRTLSKETRLDSSQAAVGELRQPLVRRLGALLRSRTVSWPS
jgi:hypothetical protein